MRDPGIEDLERELRELDENEVSRDPRVLEVLLSKRLYRIKWREKEFFVYRSGREDYLIIPRAMCTCLDFVLNAVMRRKKSSCIHLRAVEIAARKNLFKDIEVRSNKDFEHILYSIISSGQIPGEKALLHE